MTRKLTFTGIVQGIGFRPTCLRIANELGITGQVKNSGGSTHLIICGEEQALDEFVRRLIAIFEIRYYTDEKINDKKYESFSIVPSQKDSKTPFITPDLATCNDCERELTDKNNRRYMHPFISCVNCGPRYSIMRSLPYDRENIAMSEFEMCKECNDEYTLPDDRRCHAQTIACNNCGPRISMPIDDAVDIIKNGEVIAIKNTGGYHLACDIYSADAVSKLRALKGREKKPFAVMFSSVNEIKDYCRVSEKEEELLLSSARPIVLLKKYKELPENICDDSRYIGAFLPCDPIQLMLLSKISPLVMTSANISGEPIITDDDDIRKLKVAVLSHNRKILTPLDDSIVCVNSDRVQLIRRARGYVPLAIDIGIRARQTTLCLGGDLKAVFGYHKDSFVFLSQHFGDLENAEVFEAYRNNIDHFATLHSFEAEKIVSDMHPSYYSSGIFNNDMKIQHHKAHIASVIAEHRLSGGVLGFAFDGTGYGDDGAVWGGEVIAFDGKSFTRVAHLGYTKMIASDEISRNADMALACYLGGNELISKALENNINTVNSSSMGRLFDAVCALLDIRHKNTYEGECACALEACATHAEKPYPLTVSAEPVCILKEIREAMKNADRQDIALGFHYMIAELVCITAEKHAKSLGISQIALSGGVWNNRILTEKTIALLEECGFSVYINEVVPCGDGGIALGQAFISAMEV